MKVWIRNDANLAPDQKWPWAADLICVCLDDERLLFISEDGGGDISMLGMGLPSHECWEEV